MDPGHLRSYLSLVKFSHTVFALPFALVGLVLALRLNGLALAVGPLLLIVLCMVFARNAAMSFNRYIDRRIDRRNPRTAQREIPQGVIRPRQALIFAVANAALFIIATLLINRTVFLLSPLALAIVLGYSYTKRFTALCHLILGLGLGLAPIGAYLAMAGGWHHIPLLFSAIVMLWVAGFDIIYSLQDLEVDRRERLHSIPAALGRSGALAVAAALHLLVLVPVAWAGYALQANGWAHAAVYWVGAGLFLALMLLQHLAILLVGSGSGPSFGTMNGAASVVFCAFTIVALLI